MPSNQDIAYKIFTKIKNLQDEQIKANTIKEADIVEFEPESFIEDLNITVNKYLSAMGKLDIIDDVYKSILIKTQKAQSVNEFFSDNKIKIPEKMIKDTCLTVSEMRQETTVNSVAKEVTAEKNNGQQSNFDVFSQQGSIKDKMAYYDSLSDVEKEGLRLNLYGNVFGKDVAKQIVNTEKVQAEIESTEAYKGFSDEQRKDIQNTMNLYNPMKYILEELGISEEYLNNPTDLVRLSAILDQLSQGLDITPENIKNFFGEDADVEKTISDLKLKLKSDDKFKSASEKVQKLVERNHTYINKKEIEMRNAIKEILPQVTPIIDEMPSDEFISIFLLAYKEDGTINDELLAKYLSDAITRNGFDLSFETILDVISMAQNADKQQIFSNFCIVSPEMEEESVRVELSDDISYMKKSDEYTDSLEEDKEYTLDFLRSDLSVLAEGLGFEVTNEDEVYPNTYGTMEDFEGVEEPLADGVRAELQAIPVALQRINCSQEDIQKGLEAYKQMISLLTPEEIQYEPEKFAELMDRVVREIELEGVAGEVLKMMSQITFNGQIAEILQNSKETFISSLDSLTVEPILSQDSDQRINEETLNEGFNALAVDLIVAEQTVIRPEEILTDDSTPRKNEQLENQKENVTIRKLQSFMDMHKKTRTADSDVSEVSDEIKLIVQDMDKEIVNDEKDVQQEGLE